MNKIFLYDTHTHTNMEPMLSELPNIIQICKDKNIIFNCVGTCLKDSIVAVEQAKKYKGQIYATIGIHPSEIRDINDIKKLEDLYLKNEEYIVAWGEIGLDYKEGNPDKELQKLFFIKQLDVVNKYNIPVCIHVRDAEEDILEILKMVKNPNKVWIHCFAKDKNLAKQYIDRGYMISIPGIITFKNAKEVNEAIEVIPINRIMLETDGPWLAPVPMRGKINYPHYVEFVLNYLSNKLQINKQDLATKVVSNSIAFFNLKK